MNDYIKDVNFVNELIHRLMVEKEKRDRSGVYALTSQMLAYNSNRIEGSKFTQSQTINLFETGTVNAEGDIYVRAKDVEEMNGHFLMFNKMLSTYSDQLTSALIKQYHYSLKAGVFEDRLNGYPVGEFKTRANRVSDIATATPEKVDEEMNTLMEWYEGQENVSLLTLAELHARYEKIHPFQDGNGRTGRIILYKECLKNRIVPFIIKDEHKLEYNRCLNKAQKEEEYHSLAEIFENEQKDYYDEIKDFIIPIRQ